MIFVLIIGLTVFSIAYCFMVLYFYFRWKNLSDVEAENAEADVHFSIIIPARNESENLPNLLQSLQQQSYSKELFEVIVIDDHSSDGTATLAEGFPTRGTGQVGISNLKVIRLGDIQLPENLISYKKKAIEIGVEAAKNDLIITTDADCIVSSDWLKTIASYYQNNDYSIIAGPVLLSGKNNLISNFQKLDMLALTAITGATMNDGFIGLCNGANLIYKKSIFHSVGGFDNIDRIASGDDMLLLQKINNHYPGSSAYLKSRKALVYSKTEESLRDLLRQRIRWISKAKFYSDKRISAILVGVYFHNLLLLTTLVLSIANFRFLILFLIAFGIKVSVEFIFLRSAAAFFDQKKIMKWIVPVSFFHILYVLIAGVLGLFKSYEWKGRKVK